MQLSADIPQSRSIESLFKKQKQKSIEFGKTTARQRLELLQRFRDEILASESEIHQALQKDYGKNSFETVTSEIRPVLSEIRLAKSCLKKWMAPQTVSSGLLLFGMKSQIHYQGKGTVLIISPWNFPLALSFVPLVSALAAGNTVILKPSEVTPNAAAIIEKIVKKVFPEDLVAVFLGGKEVSQELIKLPFDHIFFTGATRIGQVVAKAAAENLVPVTLELGGKSPTIVDPSANIADAAEKIIWGKLVNSGQICTAPDYVFVHESIKQEFVSQCRKFLDHVAEFDSAGKVRIVSKSHYDRIRGLLKDFKDTKESDSLIIPTQLIEIEMKEATKYPIMKEEIFGPLLPIMTYRDLDAVIDFINSNDRPLALYLFTQSDETKKKVLAQTRAGGTCINQVLTHVTNHNLPFGGIGASGMGAYHGHRGFLEFSHQRAVLEQKFGNGFFKLVYPPYKPWVEKIFGFMSRAGF